MRHWPAIEPSLNPQLPLASAFAFDSAVAQLDGAKHPAFFIHTSPVR